MVYLEESFSQVTWPNLEKDLELSKHGTFILLFIPF